MEIGLGAGLSAAVVATLALASWDRFRERSPDHGIEEPGKHLDESPGITHPHITDPPISFQAPGRERVPTDPVAGSQIGHALGNLPDGSQSVLGRNSVDDTERGESKSLWTEQPLNAPGLAHLPPSREGDGTTRIQPVPPINASGTITASALPTIPDESQGSAQGALTENRSFRPERSADDQARGEALRKEFFEQPSPDSIKFTGGRRHQFPTSVQPRPDAPVHVTLNEEPPESQERSAHESEPLEGAPLSSILALAIAPAPVASPSLYVNSYTPQCRRRS